MRVAVIINPASGRRRRPAVALVALAERTLRLAGADVDAHVTAGPGDAHRLAREAVDAGAAIVFAWGGDGTINEVAGALAFTPAALAIVPGGSGNGLARALRVPVRPEAALRAGLDRPERRIDVGELGGRLFVNVAGVGLDADVALAYSRGRRRGLLPYLVLGARALATGVPTRFAIEADGERLERDALVVAVANGPQYGNGAVIAAGAQLDDGALDLVIIGALTPWKLLAESRRLFAGTLARSAAVSCRRVTHLRIEAPGPRVFHVDGEPVQGGPVLEARVHPGALRLRG